MSVILAIDPGTTHSAWVIYQSESRILLRFGKCENGELLSHLPDTARGMADEMVIEKIACYGMAVGAEVFDTCIWIGRFIEGWRAWSEKYSFLYRTAIKTHICGTPRAKDGNVRQALMDRFGGERAKGTKKAPGPLHGISGDVWSALAVAVTWADQEELKARVV